MDAIDTIYNNNNALSIACDYNNDNINVINSTYVYNNNTFNFKLNKVINTLFVSFDGKIKFYSKILILIKIKITHFV